MAIPTDPQHPPAPAASDRAKLERQRKEAAALRENLRRRKQQTRAREAADSPAPAVVPGLTSGSSDPGMD